MASNGAVASVVDMVRAFDDASKEAVLGLLVEHARGAIGVESQGIARTLLALGGMPGVPLQQHAGG
jgi:hypothetical protein